MKLDPHKVEMALAAACMNVSDLRNVVSSSTLTRILNDPNSAPNPKTVGKIARALNVTVESIIAEQEKDRG